METIDMLTNRHEYVNRETLADARMDISNVAEELEGYASGIEDSLAQFEQTLHELGEGIAIEMPDVSGLDELNEVVEELTTHEDDLLVAEESLHRDVRLPQDLLRCPSCGYSGTLSMEAVVAGALTPAPTYGTRLVCGVCEHEMSFKTGSPDNGCPTC